MNVQNQPYRTIWPAADGVSVEIIDQTRLPHAFLVARLANLDEACGQAIEVAQRIEPDAADVAAYKTGYAKWRKLYPALKSLR